MLHSGLERIDVLAMLIEQRPQDIVDSGARASQIRRLIQDLRQDLRDAGERWHERFALAERLHQEARRGVESSPSIERALRVLHLTLPEISSHDEAMNHLFYANPNANEDVRGYSIAAALFILREAEEPVR